MRKRVVIGIALLAGRALAAVAVRCGTRSGRSGRPAQTGSLCTDLAGRTVRLPQTIDRTFGYTHWGFMFERGINAVTVLRPSNIGSRVTYPRPPEARGTTGT